MIQIIVTFFEKFAAPSGSTIIAKGKNKYSCKSYNRLKQLSFRAEDNYVSVHEECRFKVHYACEIPRDGNSF